MTDNELLLKGFDLASIATWLMIIGFAVLLYTSRNPKQHKPQRTSKK